MAVAERAEQGSLQAHDSEPQKEWDDLLAQSTRGMLTGQGHLIHYYVVSPRLLPEGERVARRGNEVLISASVPTKSSTDLDNKPILTQSQELHKFAQEEAELQALEHGKPMPAKRPSALSVEDIINAMAEEAAILTSDLDSNSPQNNSPY